MIEIIHCINLSPDQQIDIYHSHELTQFVRRHREERALSVVEQSKRYGFSVRFWSGIVGDVGKNDTFRSPNIMRAFKKIVKYAKDERLPMVTIMEDDGVFTSDGAWKYYNENIPVDFDYYLGGVYQATLKNNRVISGYSGNTLLTVHERAYDFLLSANEDPLSTFLGHLDKWLGGHCMEKKIIVCQPFVIKQMGKYSDNQRRKLDYEAYENWDYLTD